MLLGLVARMIDPTAHTGQLVRSRYSLSTSEAKNASEKNIGSFNMAFQTCFLVTVYANT